MIGTWAGWCVCALAAGIWGWLAWQVWQGLRRVAGLVPPAAPAEARPGRRVAAVLPARNEEAGLAASVRSLLGQPGVELEVIVVNDHSTDRTAEVAEALAVEDARVRVLHDPPLPPGWLGKQNAQQAGVAVAAAASFLLLSDADVVHGPGLLAAAVAEMEQGGYDLLTVYPRIESETLWENVLVPFYFSSLAMLGRSGLEEPDSRNVAGVGAFLLVRRQAFAAVGGLEPIRRTLLDDVALVALFKRRGLRVGIRQAPEWLRVRPFRSNKEAFRGTTKWFSIGAQVGPGVLLLNVASTVLVLGGPAVVGGLGFSTGSLSLAGAGLAVYLFEYGTLLASRPWLRSHPGKLAFFPLAAVIAMVCGGRAFRHSRQAEVEWRGRRVSLGPTGTAPEEIP